LLHKRLGFGLLGGGEIKITGQNDIGFDGPESGALRERDVEIGQDVEPETIGGADGRAMLGPTLAGWALDVDILCRLGIEEVLSEFEVVEHGLENVPWLKRGCERWLAARSGTAEDEDEDEEYASEQE
jgi:hypothetical protein